MRSQLTNSIHYCRCWWTGQVEWLLCSNRQSPGALPKIEAPIGSGPEWPTSGHPTTRRSTARPARQAPSPAAPAPAASAQPPRSPPSAAAAAARGFGKFWERRETGEDRRRKGPNESAPRSLACASTRGPGPGLLAAGDSGRSWTLLGQRLLGQLVDWVEFRNSPTCWLFYFFLLLLK